MQDFLKMMDFSINFLKKFEYYLGKKMNWRVGKPWWFRAEAILGTCRVRFFPFLLFPIRERRIGEFVSRVLFSQNSGDLVHLPPKKQKWKKNNVFLRFKVGDLYGKATLRVVRGFLSFSIAPPLFCRNFVWEIAVCARRTHKKRQAFLLLLLLTGVKRGKCYFLSRFLSLSCAAAAAAIKRLRIEIHHANILYISRTEQKKAIHI